MTRKELLKMLFPKFELNFSGCRGIPCGTEDCDECEYHNYWEKPAIIDKTVAKVILNCLYSKEAIYYNTDSTYMVYTQRCNGKTYAQHLELIQQGWTQLPSIHNNIDWTTLNEIMCDAIVNGFEVKILNGTIYYREKQ